MERNPASMNVFLIRASIVPAKEVSALSICISERTHNTRLSTSLGVSCRATHASAMSSSADAKLVDVPDRARLSMIIDMRSQNVEAVLKFIHEGRVAKVITRGPSIDCSAMRKAKPMAAYNGQFSHSMEVDVSSMVTQLLTVPTVSWFC